ncbi:type II toxin-antitoxin system HicA family toxin [Mucilaginibacter ginkgonis]|uniref:Type II toxin-antitoxin system HicA family toxin n=1 Tax=Mucilaginibacter ginkgonis TaxID=2682091 RepID=A0A6I4HTN5_9SPHI|nr:type II toxin-antitoxin system HicA family toxin [Mucilaginibacter ginkgonis]QQL50429.1 type II toxin-antitoxin system HicA family toxin [Mucilaginibacter ginkgonis]
MPKQSYSSREIIKLLEDGGFILDQVKGSHHIYYHPVDKKRAVVPHPKKELPYGTARSILKQAGFL